MPCCLALAALLATVPPIGSSDDALTFSTQIPAHPDALRTLRQQLTGWLEQSGVDEQTSFELLLACNEIAANAIEHPIDRPTNWIGIAGHAINSNIEITISNTGHWKPPTPTPGRGHGLTLARALTDNLHLIHNNTHTTVTLNRDLTKPQPDKPQPSQD